MKLTYSLSLAFALTLTLGACTFALAQEDAGSAPKKNPTIGGANRQTQPGVRSVDPYGFYLLVRGDVIKDLELDDAKATTCKELLTKMGAESGLPNADQKAIWAKYKGDFSKHLTSSQMKRLGEIRLWVGKGKVVMWEDVQKALNITAQQIADAKEMQEKSRMDMRSILAKVQNGEMTREQANQAMLDSRSSADEGLLTVLTKDQKEKLDKMKGKPFVSEPKK